MTKKQTKQEVTAENNGHVKFNVYNGKGKSKELKTLEELKEDFKKAFEQNGIMELFIVVTNPIRKHTMNTTISANV